MPEKRHSGADLHTSMLRLLEVFSTPASEVSSLAGFFFTPHSFEIAQFRLITPQILLVEDDHHLRGKWARLLTEQGMEVSEAENGRAAMVHMQRKPADLVITDMVMPEMDGVETIVALRRGYPGVKIIAISEGGFGPAENCLKIASKLGARKTLAKPLAPQQLIEAVRELLG